MFEPCYGVGSGRVFADGKLANLLKERAGMGDAYSAGFTGRTPHHSSIIDLRVSLPGAAVAVFVISTGIASLFWFSPCCLPALKSGCVMQWDVMRCIIHVGDVRGSGMFY